LDFVLAFLFAPSKVFSLGHLDIKRGKIWLKTKRSVLKCGKWSTINEKRNKNRRVIGIGRRRKKGNFI
jgi:hypothetical protein